MYGGGKAGIVGITFYLSCSPLGAECSAELETNGAIISFESHTIREASSVPSIFVQPIEKNGVCQVVLIRVNGIAWSLDGQHR